METANRVMISSVNGDYDPSGKKRNMWIQTSLQAVMQNQKTQQNKTGARSKTGYICWNKEKNTSWKNSPQESPSGVRNLSVQHCRTGAYVLTFIV